MSVSIAVGNRRLLRLATLLEAAHWRYKRHGVNPNEVNAEAPEGYYQGRYVHRCGTPACALGHWAAAHPRRWLAAGGVLRRAFTSGSALVDQENEFGLTPEEREALFGAAGCDDARTAYEAARYIRHFVQWREERA